MHAQHDQLAVTHRVYLVGVRQLLLAIVVSVVILSGLMFRDTLFAATSVEPPGPRLTETLHFAPGIGISPRAVDVDPRTGYAYVAAEESNEVSIISGTQVITTLLVDVGPQFIQFNAGNGYTYVVNYRQGANHSITVISGTTVIADFAYASPYANIIPTALITNPRDGYVYVSIEGERNEVLVISGTAIVAHLTIDSVVQDMAVNSSTGDVYIPNGRTLMIIRGTAVVAEIELEGGVEAIGVNPSTGYVYAALATSVVQIISGTTIMATLPSESWSTDIAVNPRTGYVYIPHFQSDTVTIIHGTKVVATVSTGAYPKAVAVNLNTGYVYVVNGGGASHERDTLTVISGTQVVSTVPIGDWPRDIAIDPRTGYAYIPNKWSNDVTVVSALTAIATIPAGVFPVRIAHNPTNGYLYATDNIGNRVWVTDGRHVVAQLAVGRRPTAIVTNPVSGFVYVANADSASVTVISDTTIVATLVSGTTPVAIAVDPNGEYVYVCNFSDDTVTVIQGTEIVGTVRVVDQPQKVKVNPRTRLAYVIGANSSTISVLAGTQLAAAPQLSSSARDVAFDPEQDAVYVLDLYGMNVLRGMVVREYLDLNCQNDQGCFNAIAFNPLSRYVYALDRWQGQVVVVNEMRVVGVLPTGNDPWDIEADAGSTRVYVSNSGSGNVMVISRAQVINTISLGETAKVSRWAPSVRDIVIDQADGTMYVASPYRHTIATLTIQPDFNLTSDSSPWFIRAGTADKRVVELVAQQGFSHPVTLGVSGGPPGTVITIAPNPAPPTGTVILTVQVPAGAPVGPHTLTLRGESDGIVHQVQFPLIVFTDQIFLPMIRSPDDRSSKSSPTPSPTSSSLPTATPWPIQKPP
jgi:DNA-binding beta-propeller fold protein YncE